MLNLPMLGTAEKTETSRYQVMLVDKSDSNLMPLQYPMINRFFDNIEDRNSFINLFEGSILQAGGKLVYDAISSHPSFKSFDIFDKEGILNYELVVYL